MNKVTDAVASIAAGVTVGLLFVTIFMRDVAVDKWNLISVLHGPFPFGIY